MSIIRPLLKAVRTYMGRTAVAFMLMLLPASCLFSQDLSRKISIKAEEMPLEELIVEIENKAGVSFSYSPQVIPVSLPVSIEAKKKTLRHILKKAFRSKGIEYELVEGHIVLRAAGTDESGLTGEAASGRGSHTISGYLRDSRSGEVLIGAHIYEKESLSGTATNAYGFYSLTLPEGTHRLVYSFIGYEPAETSILLDRDMLLNQELEETMLTIREVEVRGQSDKPLFLDEQISEFRFSNKTLASLPGITGDKDIIKSLQVIPGIKSFGDGSSLFFVRGGGSDQNLILIDEVPIYNTSHLFGFLSVISPDAISDIEVFKGDYPVKYGNRLSSVVDIKTRDGNMKKFGFGGNIGPYTSSLYLEGPVIRDKSSFYLGGRFSTLDWLADMYYKDQEISVGFVDLNAKLNFKINDRNRIFGTFYIGNDQLQRRTNSSIETYGIGWYNILGTLRWNHVFSRKLFSNTTAYVTRYQYLLYLSEDQNEYWTSSIGNISLKTDFTWYINPSNTFTAGLKISAHALDAGNINLNDEAGAEEVPNYNSAEYAFYAGNEQKIGKNFSLRYGLRLPIWQDLGPTTVYYFNSNYDVIDTFDVANNAVYYSFSGFEPRINMTFMLAPGHALKAGYSRTTQFLNELNNSISPFTSLSVWVPSGPNIKPREADQYSMGYFTGFFGDRIKFSTETYYKHFYNYIDYAPHANMLYNPLIEGEIRTGEAWSYGLEMMIRKPFGRLTGWIGYTYSRVFVKSQGVNEGMTYRAFQDRPHHLTLFLSYDTEKRWSFSANWMLLSGAAITTPVSFYDYNGYVVPYYGEKNNDRLPAYHRLDLSVRFRLNREEGSRYRHSLIFNLYNAYGRTNPYFMSFNRIEGTGQDYVIPADYSGMQELVPTSLSVSEIIPSVNYQFKF
jgi:outer membrane receptor for ferrienterochelin and colicin